MKKFYLFTALFLIFNYTNIYANTVEIQPGSEGKDIIIREYIPSETFDHTWLYVRNDENNNIYRSLIEFDLSSTTQTSVISATMQLYCYEYIATSSPTIYANRITDSWTEETVSWITHENSYTTDNNTSQTGSLAIGWVTWDITDIVNDWLDPSNGINNYGLMLMTDYITDPPGNRNFFYSSDYTSDLSLRPKLILEVENIIPEPFSLILLLSGLTGIYIKRNKK